MTTTTFTISLTGLFCLDLITRQDWFPKDLPKEDPLALLQQQLL